MDLSDHEDFGHAIHFCVATNNCT